LEPAGSSQIELIRMPVALISEDYLLKAFSGKERMTYAFPFRSKLPSIEGLQIPKSEIIIFPHDVIHRKQLAKASVSAATEWEKDRCSLWFDQFNENFPDPDGSPNNSNASVLFTPTSGGYFGVFKIQKNCLICAKFWRNLTFLRFHISSINNYSPIK
jgi:hypothetical protein